MAAKKSVRSLRKRAGARADPIQMFLQHVRVHSPDEPRTARRYTAVLDHAKRILVRKLLVEAVARPGIDDFITARSAELDYVGEAATVFRLRGVEMRKLRSACGKELNYTVRTRAEDTETQGYD